MRIKEIKVTNLFGMFDHTVELKSDRHLTIVYGINGIGKTMLFKILDNFFNANFYKLIKAPFENLKITFGNDCFFEINNCKDKFIVKYYSGEKEENKEFGLSRHKAEEILMREIKNLMPVKEIGENKFILHPSDEILTTEEMIDKAYNVLPNSILKKVELPEIKELNELISQTELYFIEAQRLLKFDSVLISDPVSNERSRKEVKIEYTVKNYSKELSQIIQDKHLEYSELSEKLELSLGKRLMRKEVETISDINRLKQENEKLREKRNELKSVGLFEEPEDEEFAIPDDIDDLTKAVLSVNIQDMKSKLRIFDELHKKLNTFLGILNEKRFSYKKISIHPKKGFVFENINGKKLEVTELSSGEQHEIVLFYELLFKVPENSLVLIDEPEISLHIVWQKEFINDMSEIVRMRNFDILMATHSPQIVNGNWDITVELAKH